MGGTPRRPLRAPLAGVWGKPLPVPAEASEGPSLESLAGSFVGAIQLGHLKIIGSLR